MEFMKNENLAAEQVAENVEATTEETPKIYTEAEFNSKLDSVLGKKLARQEAKLRREFDRNNSEVNELLDVLRAGTGKESVPELRDTFTGFYSGQGVKMPDKPAYSDKDEARLARLEAEEFINSGIDDVKDELKRLADLGETKMSKREKMMFPILLSHVNSAKRKAEFINLGIDETVYDGSEFQSFLKDFKPDTPAQNIVNHYWKTIPKKDIKPMGSMVTEEPADNGIKDFYTFEEARKFTKKDFDNNPALYKRVQESMTKW